LLQLAIDWQNNSMTKVEKMFFLIFMSSYAEMSFFREKITKYDPNTFFEKGRYGFKKSVILREFQKRS
jgi:hypothetical protein